MNQILIVDDHPVLRAGLASLIAPLDDLAVCGEASNDVEALEFVDRSVPDLALVDIQIPERGGLELVKDLRQKQPSLPMLVLSMHEEALYAERAIRAGAQGYVMKAAAAGTLLGAIREVLSGHNYLSPAMTELMNDRSTTNRNRDAGWSLGRLTDREMQVFERIGNGMTTSQIATQLGLKAKTVETYRENIKCKLGLHNATELVRVAAVWASDPRMNAPVLPEVRE